MKKFLALLLLLSLALVSLCACGPDEEPQNNGGGVSNDAPPLPSGSDPSINDIDWDLL